MTGQLVTLKAYGGKLIERIVVKDLGEVILICKPEEYEKSVVENRDPLCVGFPKSSVKSE